MARYQAKILWFGNVVTQDGFARIGNELCIRLQRRGHTIGAAAIFTQHVPWNWPYQVWGLLGHDLWSELQTAIAQLQPDILIICQDWPYLHTAVNLPRLDRTQTAVIGITPTDGVPIFQQWLASVPQFDALFTISRFGVQAFRHAGVVDRW